MAAIFEFEQRLHTAIEEIGSSMTHSDMHLPLVGIAVAERVTVDAVTPTLFIVVNHLLVIVLKATLAQTHPVPESVTGIKATIDQILVDRVGTHLDAERLHSHPSLVGLLANRQIKTTSDIISQEPLPLLLGNIETAVVGRKPKRIALAFDHESSSANTIDTETQWRNIDRNHYTTIIGIDDWLIVGIADNVDCSVARRYEPSQQ